MGNDRGLPFDHYEGGGRELLGVPAWGRACNEFLNAYKISEPPPATLDEFFDLRDRHFTAKREWVQTRHAAERAWYETAFPRAPGEPAA